MREYRVELESFSGPLDLLLHLVKEQEVDVRDVSISLLLRGYLGYLERINEIDLNEATDFLVMASALLEIKSKELLPREEVDLEEVLDPRDNLVSQLLEFRRFRDLAWRLGEGWKRRGMQHTKGWGDRVKVEHEEEDPLQDLDDLDAWDLLKLYAGIMDQVGLDRKFKVMQDRKPIRAYIETLLVTLKKTPRTTFDRLFDRAEGRPALIGTFVALLEVVKRGYARCVQSEATGPIEVEWFGPEGCDAEDVLVGSNLEEPSPEPTEGDEAKAFLDQGLAALEEAVDDAEAAES